MHAHGSHAPAPSSHAGSHGGSHVASHDGRAADGETENPALEGQGPEGRLEGVKVLIVDDDRDVADAFEAALQSEGALTQVCANGNDAVRICHEEPPDLVLLDMMLPGRSGFLVLERIKGFDNSPAVVMVTANEGRRHQAYAESLGVDAYLLKPVPLAKLIETIERVLDADDE
jgi:CheY-like chemotaxis protein